MTIHDGINRGALFRNHKKADDKHSDYSGSINVDGEEFWVNGWIRESRNGVEYVSLSIKPKRMAAAKPDSRARANLALKTNENYGVPFDDSDSIPF